jgi:hypothetical protein
MHALRTMALQAALESLEPRLAGRPARSAGPGDALVEKLEAQLRELRLELQAARVREEIALGIPGLLRPRRRKKAARRKARTRATAAGAQTTCGAAASRQAADGGVAPAGNGPVDSVSEESAAAPLPSRAGLGASH